MSKLIIIAGFFAAIWVCNTHPHNHSHSHYYDVQAVTNLAAAETDPEHYIFPQPKTTLKSGEVYRYGN